MIDRIGAGIGAKGDLRSDSGCIGNIALVQLQQGLQDRIGKPAQTNQIMNGDSSGDPDRAGLRKLT